MGRLLLGSATSVVGSLVAGALLVAIGTALFPSIRGFSHFRFSDYGSLTVIGVVPACMGWPLVVRLSSSPRSLYLRLAVAVTVVLWLPDVVILVRGEPARGVAVLMVMHLAIAAVTYQAMVRLAPPVARRDSGDADWLSIERPALWFSMSCLVLVEAVIGIVCLVVIPAGRPTGWLPARDQLLYVVHAVMGAALTAAGMTLVSATATRRSRPILACAVIGLVGLAMAGAGGLLSVSHGLRVFGIVLMFLGAFVAAVGYLMPGAEKVVSTTPTSLSDV